MQHLEFTQEFETLLEKQNYRGKIVSIEHVKELQQEISGLHQKDLLDEELYRAYLASFDFECRQKLANARSLIMVSVPQPQVRVTVVLRDRFYPVIIPPTYCFQPDDQVADILRAFLKPKGYRLQKVRLPQKLLAARSGLARYGKNNITYVAGMGSFHRPVVFISDAPCAQDSWGKPSVLDLCENCKACAKACPTAAIGSDRFQLHAERCLTFHNERRNDFPEWLSPAWHNSLVGCMICQKACPANKDFVKWIEEGPAFDHEETTLLLEGTPEDNLPANTMDKLKKLGMLEYLNVIGRNLKAVLANRCRPAAGIRRSFNQYS
jgi:epoxyqueuosine reductase